MISSLPLYAVVLSSNDQLIQSEFFHFGTTHEYINHLTSNKKFSNFLCVKTMARCSGIPYKLIPNTENQNFVPCIMMSKFGIKVCIGQKVVTEYCNLKIGCTVGNNCILSNCDFSPYSDIPENVFMHTIAVNIGNTKVGIKYATV